ncbi:MAG: TIGR02186 family protein [Deltaproteobacteria bacterium]|nr:TIGR02186 family protein [Deltaproteobacteria bacterium]MBW1953329.1 TIGR02186 family protein [Deltaproteobacteria bacterium]MBW1986878.1 TIGR02186 family protein [Deltaproteobacteria bacterium]MBW2135555.1 TIGR02186 family protein [Deltaproteobacteria bacterium]
MKRALTILVALGLAGWLSGPAQAITKEAQQKVLTAATKNLIEIGLAYRGDRIHFFGVHPVPDTDLIVKLTAEKSEAVKLSVKGKVGPFWMTVKQYEVTGVPFMYKIHAQKPLDQIISPATAQELELGYPSIRHHMKMHLLRGKAAPDDEETLFNGLIKLKERINLYNIVEDPQRLLVTEGRVFQHYFRFPPAATEGRYLVESFCFDKGELVGYGKDMIEIKKVGVENWLTSTSQNSPLFFGILAVIVALGAGLGVGLIFKKGGH